MTLAPIWSMQPMQNSLLDVIPLRTLDPGSMTPVATSQQSRIDSKYRMGEGLLSEDERPAALWFEAKRDTFGDADVARLLDQHRVFTINSLIFVSGDLADIFMTCDLGDGRMTPVPVLVNDRATTFGTTVYLLEYQNHKDTVDRANTDRCKPMFSYGPNKYFTLPLNLVGRDVYVNPSAVAGADVWFDPIIYGTQFASDALARQLIARGYGDAFMVNQCKYLDK